jgi:hypothetical protein
MKYWVGILFLSHTVFAAHPASDKPSKFEVINYIYDLLIEANSGSDFNSKLVDEGFEKILQDDSSFFRFSESLLGYQRAMFGDYIEFLNRSKNTDAVVLEAEMNTRITVSIYKDVVSFSVPRGEREIFVEDYSSKAEPIAHLLPRMSDTQYEWFRSRLVEEFLLNRSASKKILKLKLEFVVINAAQNAFQTALALGLSEHHAQEYVMQEKLKAEAAAIRSPVYLVDPLLMEILMLTSTRNFYGTRGQKELGYMRAQDILKVIVDVDKTPEAHFLRRVIENFKKPETCLAFFK